MLGFGHNACQRVPNPETPKSTNGVRPAPRGGGSALAAKAVKRGLDVKSFEVKDVVHTGKTYSQQVLIKQGIEKDVSKKIVKIIKDSKAKVQAAIQGEEVRVTGKKRDDLQGVMQLIREADLGQPFQFKNFRD